MGICTLFTGLAMLWIPKSDDTHMISDIALGMTITLLLISTIWIADDGYLAASILTLISILIPLIEYLRDSDDKLLQHYHLIIYISIITRAYTLLPPLRATLVTVILLAIAIQTYQISSDSYSPRTIEAEDILQ
jgi:hypothetical protein